MAAEQTRLDHSLVSGVRVQRTAGHGVPRAVDRPHKRSEDWTCGSGLLRSVQQFTKRAPVQVRRIASTG